jgi:hypothetical protein
MAAAQASTANRERHSASTGVQGELLLLTVCHAHVLYSISLHVPAILAAWHVKASPPSVRAWLATQSAMSSVVVKAAVRHQIPVKDLPAAATILTCSLLCIAGHCLNRAVTHRNTLQLGMDIDEVDSWGMDCYVRRNIMDGERLLLRLRFPLNC